MFKKISKNLIIFSSLFLTFFCFQNVFAYTEIVSDDFDSYNLNDGLSGKNGFYSGSYYDTYISNDVFSSSPYSLKMEHANNRFYKDLTDDYTGLEEVYIEQDVYLSNDWSGLEIGIGNFHFALAFNSYYGTYFDSNASEAMFTIDNDTSCSSNDYCQSWFNLGLKIFLDKTINTLYYSVYIDNVFINTYILTNYTSNLYTFEEFGNTNYIPVYIDNLIISDAIPPSTINGVCGSANGSTFDWADFDNQDFCSSGDFYLSGDNGERMIYACVGLNGGTTQYNCFADYYHDLDPTITDVIDFDFDNFTYDFDEGDVSKNWLIDVFKFLFLPREQTLQKFFTTFENFKQKIPFGYIYLIQDKFKQVSLESTEEFALNLELLGEDYEVFSVTSLKQDIGENTFNVFYNTMKALIWFIFVLYLITKSQKLFNNND